MLVSAERGLVPVILCLNKIDLLEDDEIASGFKNTYQACGYPVVMTSAVGGDGLSLLEEKFGPNEIHLTRSNHHVRNFLDCIKTRNETVCSIDAAVKADIVCHLSDIAIRTKRKIIWDPVKEEIINDEQASLRLTRSMRSPWRL